MLDPEQVEEGDSVGGQLKRLRKHAGLAVSELAEAAGLDVDVVHGIERGGWDIETEGVIDLASALGVLYDAVTLRQFASVSRMDVLEDCYEPTTDSVDPITFPFDRQQLTPRFARLTDEVDGQSAHPSESSGGVTVMDL